jgi:ABC-type polar amino acid transport system ATPase subunit
MEPAMTALSVQGLGVRRGGRLVVSGVSFDVTRGEIVALMGASGSGKSSVLRATAGLEPVDAGSIDLSGFTLGPGPLPRGARQRELASRVGVVFQFHHLFSHLTALENVSLALVHVLGQPAAAADARARALLDRFGVAHRALARPHELSGGEAQRVAIARALAVEPPLLLMDEPTASLDADRRADLLLMLRDLAADGRAVVVATHDADVAAGASRVIRMKAGVAQGAVS